ncbi:unnamed protein product [Pleuronectes platessa]|uniref:Uncharacterized protein n=1 Tax=Pleuronectes platessa TaxID=8262 RepID=A0A9N7TLJ0_PLEPL|nr:unnamed protein product [Pleuronectes platessa]
MMRTRLWNQVEREQIRTRPEFESRQLVLIYDPEGGGARSRRRTRRPEHTQLVADELETTDVWISCEPALKGLWRKSMVCFSPIPREPEVHRLGSMPLREQSAGLTCHVTTGSAPEDQSEDEDDVTLLRQTSWESSGASRNFSMWTKTNLEKSSWLLRRPAPLRPDAPYLVKLCDNSTHRPSEEAGLCAALDLPELQSVFLLQGGSGLESKLNLWLTELHDSRDRSVEPVFPKKKKMRGRHSVVPLSVSVRVTRIQCEVESVRTSGGFICHLHSFICVSSHSAADEMNLGGAWTLIGGDHVTDMPQMPG